MHFLQVYIVKVKKAEMPLEKENTIFIWLTAWSFILGYVQVDIYHYVIIDRTYVGQLFHPVPEVHVTSFAVLVPVSISSHLLVRKWR